ncbi:MAG TPA: helix-turn-helix domain-containing protein [Candidatus Polarisedimenticolaceae bacterium]|nr:helix-turn-helix domain-containing protein [Candidatus Polarisedimenticolaceae bacterium]
MASFGEKLRRARESRSITLEEIADGTKIGVRYLRALEENDFEPLPGGVFDRGYVRAFAQAVGLDPDATVRAFLAERRSAEPDPPEDRTIEALHLAADRNAAASSATFPRLSLPISLWTALIAVGAVAALGLGAWGIAALIDSGESGGASGRPPAPSSAPAGPAVEGGQAEAAGELRETADPPSDDRPPRAVEPAADVDPAPVPEAATPPEPVPARPAPVPEPPPEEPERDTAPVDAEANGGLRARIVIGRPVTGSLNCDNRRVEMLDGLRAGTELQLTCRRYLLLNVADGGAIRVGLNGAPPQPLASDGERLHGYRITP